MSFHAITANVHVLNLRLQMLKYTVISIDYLIWLLT